MDRAAGGPGISLAWEVDPSILATVPPGRQRRVVAHEHRSTRDGSHQVHVLGVLDSSTSSWWIYDLVVNEVRSITSGDLLRRYPHATACTQVWRCAA